jgi:hypothetical protein
MSLDATLTLSISLASALLLALSAWQSSRKRPDSVRPRWTPWRFLIFVAGAILFLALIHLTTVLGLRPPTAASSLLDRSSLPPLAIG